MHDQGTKAGYERWVYTDRSRPPRTPLCFSLPHRRDIFHRHPHIHTDVTLLTSIHPDSHLLGGKKRGALHVQDSRLTEMWSSQMFSGDKEIFFATPITILAQEVHDTSTLADAKNDWTSFHSRVVSTRPRPNCIAGPFYASKSRTDHRAMVSPLGGSQEAGP